MLFHNINRYFEPKYKMKSTTECIINLTVKNSLVESNFYHVGDTNLKHNYMLLFDLKTFYVYFETNFKRFLKISE